MPAFASLIHPLICPYCEKLTAHEIQFLEDYFQGDSQIDLRLDECIDTSQLAESMMETQSLLQKGVRTHGLSLCGHCQTETVSLISIEGRRPTGIEVFPRKIQVLLARFPFCLYLESQNDRDLVLLSELLESHGASKLIQAIQKLTPQFYSDDYWQSRHIQNQELVKNLPAVKDFIEVMQSPSSDPSNEAAILETLSQILESQTFTDTLQNQHRQHQDLQKRKHQELHKILGQTTHP